MDKDTLDEWGGFQKTVRFQTSIWLFGRRARAQPFCAERRTLKVVTAGDRTPTLRNRNVNEHSLALAREWKRLGRAATAVAVLTSPILFVAARQRRSTGPGTGPRSARFALIVIFRGAVDVLAHKLIPSPTIYGAETELASTTT